LLPAKRDRESAVVPNETLNRAALADIDGLPQGIGPDNALSLHATSLRNGCSDPAVATIPLRRSTANVPRRVAEVLDFGKGADHGYCGDIAIPQGNCPT
jgi:hypothetical protein